MQEERNAQTRQVPLFPWRIDNAVRGAFQEIIGQALQHVTYIDHNFIGLRHNGHPFIVGIQQLQTACAGPHEERDSVDVFMLLRPNS